MSQEVESRVERTADLRRKLRGDVWTDRTGKTFKVEEMNSLHAANLERLLLAIGPVLHDAECAAYCFGPQPTSDGAMMAFDQELDELLDADPEQWMRRQPLMVALRRASE